jgi:FkbM family methyltransferase
MTVFIDCGAHCGESILRAKHHFGIDTKVISFEPIPYFAKEISKIWKDDDSVDVVNAAVWIEEGTTNFQIASSNTDGSSLFKLPDSEGDLKIVVNTFDFSNFLKQFEKKDFKLVVKLDIEGAEYHVLHKMIEDGTINYIDELWGEWHELKTDEQREYKEEIFSYLKENNMVFREWEQYIPLVGKAHAQLAERPHKLKDII